MQSGHIGTTPVPHIAIQMSLPSVKELARDDTRLCESSKYLPTGREAHEASFTRLHMFQYSVQYLAQVERRNLHALSVQSQQRDCRYLWWQVL